MQNAQEMECAENQVHLYPLLACTRYHFDVHTRISVPIFSKHATNSLRKIHPKKYVEFNRDAG